MTIDLLSHHWPGCPQWLVFLCLVLVDLEGMVGSIVAIRLPNVFLQIGIEVAKEIGYLVEIGGLETFPSKIR